MSVGGIKWPWELDCWMEVKRSLRSWILYQTVLRWCLYFNNTNSAETGKLETEHCTEIDVFLNCWTENGIKKVKSDVQKKLLFCLVLFCTIRFNNIVRDSTNACPLIMSLKWCFDGAYFLVKLQPAVLINVVLIKQKACMGTRCWHYTRKDVKVVYIKARTFIIKPS